MITGLWVVLGLGILYVTLADALETLVLPRSVDRPLSLTVLFYTVLDKGFRALGRRWVRTGKGQKVLGAYAPITLLLLIGLWAGLLISGFGLIFYGLQVPITNVSGTPSLSEYLYLTAVTFFTLGYGDLTASNSVGRVIEVFTAGTGFLFLALVISYLPVMYSAFSRRESSLLLLDARAGSPPCAHTLLIRHQACGAASLRQLLEQNEQWAAQVLESTLSYPMLAYYRSQHEDLTWVGASTVMMDTCALLQAAVDPVDSEQRQLLRQAQLTFAMVRHLCVDVAYILDMAPREPVTPRLDRAGFEILLADLERVGFPIRSDRQAVWDRLSELRAQYEPYLMGMERNLFVPVPGWQAPTEVRDSWQTAAWDNTRHF